MENSNMLDPAAMYGIPPCTAGMTPAIAREEPEAVPAQTRAAPPPTSASSVPEDIDFTAIPTNPNLPSLEEIASYNYLNAQERQRQRQQLQRSGSQQLPYLLNGGTSAAPSPLSQYPTPPLASSAPSPMPSDIRGIVPGGSMDGTGSPDVTALPPTAMSSPMPGSMEAITPSSQPTSIPAESLQYMNGFLRTQIGRIVMVQFLVGTNTLIDKMGILLAVGANYILINETESDDILACDFYNIKFVKFYY